MDYKPEVDLPRAGEDVIRGAVKVDRGQSILWPVADLVEDGLDAGVGPDVPDLHHLIRAETDQVISVFV